MKAHTISFSAAALIAAVAAGCSSTSVRNPDGTYSNQTKGAAAGAAAGAVLGGIIGNNGPHGNTEKGAAIGAVGGAIAGGALGRRADERTATSASPVYSADSNYSVQSVPPAPVSEPQENPPPQPSANAVWIRGHYAYTGAGYQWESGRWEVPPTGTSTYVQPSWQPAANGGYVYVRGHWQ